MQNQHFVGSESEGEEKGTSNDQETSTTHSPKFKRKPGSPEDIPSSSLLLASWVLSLLLATLNYIARLLEGG